MQRLWKHLLDLLLCPLEIAANFLRISHTLLEALSRPCKACLRLLLQLKELAVLGIQLSGSVAQNRFSICTQMFRRLHHATASSRFIAADPSVGVLRLTIVKSKKLHSRLRLHGHAAVKGNWVESVGEAILHVILEVDAASGMGAFIFSVAAISSVARRGGRVASIAVGIDTRGRADGVFALGRGDGVLAISGVVGMLAGHIHWHGIGDLGVVCGHGDQLMECECESLVARMVVEFG